jgi:hypothetical protein
MIAKGWQSFSIRFKASHKDHNGVRRQTHSPIPDTPRRRELGTLMTNTEQNTIVVEQSDGLWRVLIHPDQVQTFGSRELAVAHAQQLACSRVPASTVVVREPAAD